MIWDMICVFNNWDDDYVQTDIKLGVLSWLINCFVCGVLSVLLSVVDPHAACHLVFSIVEASVPVNLAESHRPWKSLPSYIIYRTKALPLTFSKLSLIFYPRVRVLIEIPHIYPLIRYIQVILSTKTIVHAILPWTTIHHTSVLTV